MSTTKKLPRKQNPSTKSNASTKTVSKFNPDKYTFKSLYEILVLASNRTNGLNEIKHGSIAALAKIYNENFCKGHPHDPKFVITSVRGSTSLTSGFLTRVRDVWDNYHPIYTCLPEGLTVADFLTNNYGHKVEAYRTETALQNDPELETRIQTQTTSDSPDDISEKPVPTAHQTSIQTRIRMPRKNAE